MRMEVWEYGGVGVWEFTHTPILPFTHTEFLCRVTHLKFN
jgi:hypothetical protein